MRNRRPNIGSVPSPCILVCRIEDGYCAGCKRTIDEIRDWIIMSEYEQKKLLHELKWRQELKKCVSCGNPSKEDFCEFCLNEE